MQTVLARIESVSLVKPLVASAQLNERNVSATRLATS
jgi:hypothetical protein